MIFTVTCILLSKFNNSGEYAPVTMGIRCMGYYFKLEDAISSVTNNELDIHEETFNYVVVESCCEGVYASGDMNEQYWFEWNKEQEKYQSCDCPEHYKNMTRIGIG